MAVAPSILEEVYSVEDALVVGGFLISLLNHADRVRSACLAQLVNVIAPIMTETGGPAWRQTIFYPFAQMSSLRARRRAKGIGRVRNLRGGVLPTMRKTLSTPCHGAAYLKLSAVANGRGELALFALNRDLEQEMTVLVNARGFGRLAVAEATVLTDSDLKAANSKSGPIASSRRS